MTKPKPKPQSPPEHSADCQRKTLGVWDPKGCPRCAWFIRRIEG
jgi:hypothetical protein